MTKNELQTKGYASGIPVFCEHSEIADVVKVVPNPKNDNVHPDHQIDLLVRFIKHRGWRSPITISTQSGFIVRGEGRFLAAVSAGWDEVPVDYQDYESEAEELADLKADNRIMVFSHPDASKEKELIQELVDLDVDLELVGFAGDDISAILDELDVEKYFEDAPTPDIPDTEDDMGDANNEITCPHCGKLINLAEL